MLDALNSQAIQVHYQPIISLQDGKIAGAECRRVAASAPALRPRRFFRPAMK
jgi:sensor c-di-GMP phosphodiesterase-like protein